jgi:hypothetical protein
VEEIVPQIARFIGHLLLELFWYYTSRIVLPLASVGYLQVQPLTERDQAAWWWQRPFRRLPSGRIEVSVSMASAIGLAVWGALLLWIVLS